MTVVLDIRTPHECQLSLSEQGFDIVLLPSFSALDPRVASHPDMLIFVYGNKIFTPRAYYKEAHTELDRLALLTEKDLVLTDDILLPEYPRDIAFNSFICNGHIFGNTKHISSEMHKITSADGIKSVNVRQGYAKCSTVVLNGAIITADIGIHRKAIGHNIDSLAVSGEGVILNGYNCGFIGGASGFCKEMSTVYFCGNIDLHPDGEKIKSFCTPKTPLPLCLALLQDLKHRKVYL